jgi:SOS-response transcriptional repressor LexA
MTRKVGWKPYHVSSTEILRFIAAFTKEFGSPPSIRQMQRALGYKSSASVQRIIDLLEEQGYLTRDPFTRKARLVNGFAPELCDHDYRLTGDGDEEHGTVTIQCVACGRRTEVEYEGETDDPATWLLRWVGEVK